MTQILKSKNLELHINLPLSGYQKTRFDWTGKIIKVKFQNILLSSMERMEMNADNKEFGCGFYNEFGIERPIGYDEAAENGWFHKIGVGLLQRNAKPYSFSTAYPLKPLDFEVMAAANQLTIHCKAELINGYAYQLKKEIEVFQNSWQVRYHLENTGTKTIQTDEYNHNFVAFNQASIDSNYILKFPFELKPLLFGETVNPEGKVDIGQRMVQFKGEHHNPFFFSNLSGDEEVDASWKLINLDHNISLSETASFQTSKINLWGWSHVISPELFFDICVEPNAAVEWSRTYEVERLV